ncbi:hypothetical protein NLJ89_g1088 [Agrocybe chaxingu]|uniref:F-box domain-containing protein n=1 Tax=Agrocybe chaxingu TaxID=84603 RepID=A0A9W8N0M4_9AGAR|nr:hypothetical protein NLJ89_g1088 [Agrocybe chaxingu]
MSDYESPILVTHVCQKWRNVAHATPELWSSLHIALPRYDRPYAQRPEQKEPHKQAFREAIRAQAAGVEEWLRRSAPHPLCLSIACGREPKMDEPTALAIVHSTLRFSSRWDSLDLTLPPLYLARFLASTDVPMLQSIGIKIVDASGGLSSELWERSELLKAPKLRKLVAPCLSNSPARLPLNWMQLTALSFFSLRLQGVVNLPNILQALEQCTQLSSLSLSFGDRRGYSPDHQTPSTNPVVVSLPYLEKLFIGDGAHDLTRLFQVLETPLLRKFTYTTTEKAYHAPPSFEILSSFLSRTPGVRKLAIDPKHLTRDEFVEVLRQCPHLRFLKTSEHYQCPDDCKNDSKLINGKLLELFAGTHPTEPGICPELEEIEWRYCSGFSDDEMLKFVVSKCGGAVSGVAKLKRVHVKFERTKEKSISEVTKQFEEEGLEFDASYCSDDEYMEQRSSAWDGLPGYDL